MVNLFRFLLITPSLNRKESCTAINFSKHMYLASEMTGFYSHMSGLNLPNAFQTHYVLPMLLVSKPATIDPMRLNARLIFSWLHIASHECTSGNELIVILCRLNVVTCLKTVLWMNLMNVQFRERNVCL